MLTPYERWLRSLRCGSRVLVSHLFSSQSGTAEVLRSHRSGLRLRMVSGDNFFLGMVLSEDWHIYGGQGYPFPKPL